MKLPRDISEGAAARRALLGDAIAALAIAALLVALTAGLGVVAIIALPILLLVLLWVGIESALRRLRGAGR